MLKSTHQKGNSARLSCRGIQVLKTEQISIFPAGNRDMDTVTTNTANVFASSGDRRTLEGLSQPVRFHCATPRLTPCIAHPCRTLRQQSSSPSPNLTTTPTQVRPCGTCWSARIQHHYRRTVRSRAQDQNMQARVTCPALNTHRLTTTTQDSEE